MAIYIDIRSDSATANIRRGSLNGTIDGVNRQFTLPEATPPETKSDFSIFRNGQLIDTRDYQYAFPNQVTFIDPDDPMYPPEVGFIPKGSDRLEYLAY